MFYDARLTSNLLQAQRLPCRPIASLRGLPHRRPHNHLPYHHLRRAKGHEYSNSSSTGKRKEKDIIPPSGWTLKEEEKKIERKLTYEKTAEELEEETARYVKEQLKPKVPPPREKVPLELGKKLLANLDNPPIPKSLPSDYDRTLIKAHKQRN